MGVQQHVDAEFVAFLNDLSNFADVCVVKFAPFGLHSLPGHMQPDRIEAPAPQIGQVDVR